MTIDWRILWPRERDMLIAAKVMGWTNIHHIGQYRWGRPTPDSGSTIISEYSTAIAAAWRVVEHFEQVHLYKSIDHYVCQIEDYTTMTAYRGDGETAPEAICVAALRACGHEVIVT